jgi:hypothetical protein
MPQLGEVLNITVESETVRHPDTPTTTTLQVTTSHTTETDAHFRRQIYLDNLCPRDALAVENPPRSSEGHVFEKMAIILS